MSELPTSYGHYRVVGRLGAGGMGQVLLAHDPRLERDVALKVLPRDLARDPEALARFRREALLLASLNHPNIATLHGFEEDADGTVALVMERVEGSLLADRIDAAPLAPEEALRVCAQVAEALEVAHERGVIHRDLKPGNVMIGPRGLVKVLDFGIAKRRADADDTKPAAHTGAITMISPAASAGGAAGAASAAAGAAETVVGPRTSAPGAGSGSPPSRADHPITQWGVVVGTPAYMSPEQVMAGDQDARTDLFSFGCVLFECLSGKRTFSGDTAYDVMQSVLHEAPDFSQLPAATPPSIRALIERCLEKDRDRRLPAARDARHALEEALGIRRAAAVRGGEAPTTPNNLPASLSRFIGREALVANGVKRLAVARLLTLAGIGGSGKTRVALRIAEDSFAAFPDGVWFADLGAIQDPTRVPEAVADVSGVTEEPGTPLTETLARHFRTRRALLVLDNCEDVLAGCAPLVQRLLAEAAGLRVLATTREPLGVAGEEIAAVPPLALPPDPAKTDLATVAANESVALFVERATQAQPAFALDAGNVSAVVQICRQLDGIPLAIELAAARARVLSVEEIRARLGDRFRLLGGATTTSTGRRQTLRATIAWSVDHLAEDERLVFRALAVFVGGWTLEGALHVSAAEPDEFELLDAIQRLVDKSLVVVIPSAGGATRYRYLESVREFALEQLAKAGERDGAFDRHAAEFVAIAAASPGALAGRDQKSELARLDLAHDDLMSAFAWTANRPGGAALGLRLAGSLWRYWSARGHFALGRRTLNEALDRDLAITPAADRARSPERANALVRAGGFALYEGDAAAARPLVEESLAISGALADRRGEARCQSALAVIATYSGDMASARERAAASLALYRELGEAHGAALALHNMGDATLRGGDPAGAAPLYEQAIAALRATGDVRSLALALSDYAMVALRLEDQQQAEARFAEALEHARALGAPREGVYALEGVAELAERRGELERAAGWLGVADQARATLTLPLTPAEKAEAKALSGRLEARLGSEVVARVRAANSGSSWENAVVSALEWLKSGPSGPGGSPRDP